MKTLQVFTSAVIGMIATSSAATYNYTIQDAFKVGLFVQGNATVGRVESEGAIVVGGNLTTGADPFDVRLRAGAYMVNSVGLAVGGNIAFGAAGPPGVKVAASVAYGSSAPVDTPPGTWVNITSLDTTLAPGGTPVGSRAIDKGGIVNVTQAFNDLKTMSATIAAMAGPIFVGSPTPVAKIISNNFVIPPASTAAVTNPAVFKQSFYLYNVSASAINGQATNLFANPGVDNTNDIIVFNIINDLGPGATLNFNLNLSIDGLTDAGASNPWADNILWNISDPQLTFTNGIEFIGTLLAPNSLFIAGGPSVEGAFIVQSYNGSGSGELHPISGANLIAASVVPEPTSALAGVLLSLGLMRRKRG